MAVYIPSGGGILIKDATATPDDVASGMIFYNNDGRQVGIGKMVKKILFPQDLSTPSESSDTISGYTYSSSDGYTFGLYDVDTGAFWKGYYCKISGIEHIIGVEIDGHYSFCPSASNSIYTIYGIRNNNTDYYFEPWFYHYKDTVYLTCDPNYDQLPEYRNRQIIIHYTDQ